MRSLHGSFLTQLVRVVGFLSLCSCQYISLQGPRLELDALLYCLLPLSSIPAVELIATAKKHSFRFARSLERQASPQRGFHSDPINSILPRK
ncbi:hypothetical protein F5B17DRAFT_420898 [Nemania serpens]|nr:hypothetical protein F5B17DRAFT_420898 [Nemania serpens]